MIKGILVTCISQYPWISPGENLLPEREGSRSPPIFTVLSDRFILHLSYRVPS